MIMRKILILANFCIFLYGYLMKALAGAVDGQVWKIEKRFMVGFLCSFIQSS